MAAATASFTLTRLITSTKSFSNSTRTSFLPHKTFNSKPKSLKFSTKISATIAEGDTLPESTFSYFDIEEEKGDLKTVTVSELTKGKKTVLFAVPGAFTPTCSLKHVPGFAGLTAQLKDKGVDNIACISVNDAFVMKVWKKDFKADYPTIGEILFLSDGIAAFTKAIGCELDLTDNPAGLGVRSRRYAMIIEDGVVKKLCLEEGGALDVSTADTVLEAL